MPALIFHETDNSSPLNYLHHDCLGGFMNRIFDNKRHFNCFVNIDH